MVSRSEQSFGARLRKAQDLLQYIKGFIGYAPPRPNESINSFKTLITTVVSSNSEATVFLQNYNSAVKDRQDDFRTNEFSLDKLLAPIRGVVLSQFGKKSTEFHQVNTIIAKIREGRLKKKIAEDGSTLSAHSSSERSFGSSTQFFNDLVSTLGTFPTYVPSKVELRVNQLVIFQDKLTTLNNNVALTYQKLNESRDNRNVIYDDLEDRVGRIKSYVKGNYGVNSQEYKLIKGL